MKRPSWLCPTFLQNNLDRIKRKQTILYAGYHGGGGLVKEEMVENAYACRHTHTNDFIVGTSTDLWDRM